MTSNGFPVIPKPRLVARRTIWNGCALYAAVLIAMAGAMELWHDDAPDWARVAIRVVLIGAIGLAGPAISYSSGHWRVAPRASTRATRRAPG